MKMTNVATVGSVVIKIFKLVRTYGRDSKDHLLNNDIYYVGTVVKTIIIRMRTSYTYGGVALHVTHFVRDFFA